MCCLASGAPDFALGDRVTILYMAQDPEDFRIDTFDRLWSSTIFVTIFACFWLTFGPVAWDLSSGIELFVLGERAFTVIAGVAAAVGAVALWTTFDLYSSGVRIEGIVLEVRQMRRIEQEETTRLDGREIEFHGSGGSATSFEAGQPVTVLYDPTNPIRARIVSFLDLWLPSIVAFAVAVLFGGAVALSRRARRRSAHGIS